MATEYNLAQLFKAIADGENAVEAARQNLCGNPDVEVRSLFRMLDTAGIGVVTPANLVRFMLT